MAKAVRSDDVESLFAHAIQGKKLDVSALQNKMVKQKLPPHMNLSIVGQRGARDITIVWGDDERYWKWTTMEIGGHCVEVAELKAVCWLEIYGRYSTQKLTKGINYEVKFVFKLLNHLNIDEPVKFSLITPDGCKQERNQDLKGMPRNQILGFSAGEFQAQKAWGCGEIQFSMMHTDAGFWKTGLVVIGALIVPKF